MKLLLGDIILTTSQEKELSELDALYGEACGYFKFDSARPLIHPRSCMRGGDLPPGGKPENYELLSIYVGGVMVGYAALYRDFPGKQSVQIPLLFISEKARRCGFGTTIVRALKQYFYETGYHNLRVLVSLRNWGALRFWYRHGFDRVLCVETEGELTDGGNGSIGLECSLDKN
ncbi:MAG: GNAT family N-acetyltransferase [Clostridia bacterium]|nr:GNAT family N-acetyltransferase [Oscillospiraceae bacterium]MBQ6797176.1 GNAT family N-acetyltransferase [Clostridia bacterium]